MFPPQGGAIAIFNCRRYVVVCSRGAYRTYTRGSIHVFKIAHSRIHDQIFSIIFLFDCHYCGRSTLSLCYYRSGLVN